MRDIIIMLTKEGLFKIIVFAVNMTSTWSFDHMQNLFFLDEQERQMLFKQQSCMQENQEAINLNKKAQNGAMLPTR